MAAITLVRHHFRGTFGFVFSWSFFLTLLPPACPGAELFRDDFSGIPPRVLSEPVKQLTNAIQEYHYLQHRGVALGPWTNAIVHDDVWAGGDEDGVPYLEQHTVNDSARWTHPLMITGDPEWSDYTLEVKVRPLALSDMAGIAFRYHTRGHSGRQEESACIRIGSRSEDQEKER